MKKNLRVSVVLIAIAIFISGQVVVKAQTFKKGDLVGNLGVAFGWYGYSYYGAGVTSLPAFTLSLEDGIVDINNVGIISAGGIIGIKHGSWSYYSTDGSYNDFVVAARGALHPAFIKVKKLDTYAGIALGVRIHNEKYPYSGYINDNYTQALESLYIGARYFFTDKFAGFSELGYGLGYFTIGVSYKFISK